MASTCTQGQSNKRGNIGGHRSSDLCQNGESDGNPPECTNDSLVTAVTHQGKKKGVSTSLQMEPIALIYSGVETVPIHVCSMERSVVSRDVV